MDIEDIKKLLIEKDRLYSDFFEYQNDNTKKERIIYIRNRLKEINDKIFEVLPCFIPPNIETDLIDLY